MSHQTAGEILPFWQDFLDEMTAQRKQIWNNFVARWKEEEDLLPDVAVTIGALFVNLRIDLERARTAMRQGSLSRIEIDPAPTEEITDTQILDAWTEWFFELEDAVCETYGCDTIALGDPEQETLFAVLSRKRQKDDVLAASPR